MYPSTNGMIITGKVGKDSNGYPCVKFSLEDKALFEDGREYAIMVLGKVDHKRTCRDSMRIVLEKH